MAHWNQTIMVFSGYASGETDFAACFAQSSAEVQAALLGIAQRVATAATDPNATAVLSLLGHSDRQDRADMNADQRRQNEWDAAAARVASAGAWFMDRIAELIGPYDGSTGWARILILRGSMGASELVFKTPADETQRRQSRRVEINVYSSNMVVFPEEIEVIDL